MSLAQVFDHALGSWEGTNGFRLMPSDPLSEAPASGTVSLAAGGCVATIAYTWIHPQDGAQDGLLALGIGGGDNSITALWGDSWHQHPEVKIFEGTIDERGLISAGYEYADGWRWEIILDPTEADLLSLRMDNVVLPEAATAEIPAVAYAAMLMELRRTS
jgi:hypothetical protein